MSGQIQVALKVGAIDDVEDGVRALAYQIVSCNYLLKCVGGQRIDSGEVGDDDAVMLFQPSLFFSTVTPGQFPTN